MLFHTLYNPNSEQYFEQFITIINNYNFNKLAFKKSWNHLIKKYQNFRISINWETFSNLYQIVLKKIILPWKEFNWKNYKIEQQQSNNDKNTLINQKLNEFIEQDRKIGFKLNQSPLIRFYLIQMNNKKNIIDNNNINNKNIDSSFIFIWDSHHLLSDGWSMPLIIKEIYTFYEMEYKNIQTIKKLIILNSFETIKKDYLLTISSTDYKSYIVWLLERDFIEAKLFWNQELKGFIKPIQLPKKMKYDQQQKEIVEIKQHENKEKEIVFSNKILLTIKEILKNNHLTSNTLIQGIWGLILSIYNIDNTSDILFGATVSGRSSPSIDIIKIESIIGLFINTLPVRIIIDHNKTLIEWLQNIQLHQIEARQYEYTPLVKIQSWSEIKPKGTPIFETLLVFENYPTAIISKNNDNDNGSENH